MFHIQSYSLLNSGAGGGFAITVSDTPPSNPKNGQPWVDTTKMRLYVYYVDGDSGQWVDVSGSYAAGPYVIISETEPLSPETNQIWLQPSTMNQFLWYNDGDSTQWVQIGVSFT